MSNQDIKQHVQSQFDNVAANYRTSVVHATGEDLRLMVEHAPTSPDAIVLDAGCGAGHTALAFAPHVKQVTAYDFTASMLDQVNQLAQEREITNVITQEGDAENLPFDDATFDIVATRYSSHHWLHPETALAEFKRVLKPKGTFIISDIMAREDYAQDTFLQTLELLRDPSHVRDYRISEWQRMIHDAGFSSEVIYTFDLTLHFDKWITRMATPTQNTEMLKALFNIASNDIKQGFALPKKITENDFNFVIPGAVIIGRI
jgi:ubiquinone/menaquinone biosynthesis C-methylase UbiE